MLKTAFQYIMIKAIPALFTVAVCSGNASVVVAVISTLTISFKSTFSKVWGLVPKSIIKAHFCVYKEASYSFLQATDDRPVIVHRKVEFWVASKTTWTVWPLSSPPVVFATVKHDICRSIADHQLKPTQLDTVSTFTLALTLTTILYS